MARETSGQINKQCKHTGHSLGPSVNTTCWREQGVGAECLLASKRVLIQPDSTLTPIRRRFVCVGVCGSRHMWRRCFCLNSWTCVTRLNKESCRVLHLLSLMSYSVRAVTVKVSRWKWKWLSAKFFGCSPFIMYKDKCFMTFGLRMCQCCKYYRRSNLQNLNTFPTF